MKKFVIVQASSVGPVLIERDSLDGLASLLMDFFRHGCSGNTATLWKRSRGQWSPVFPWQHAQ